jgi:hypothetical protein
MPDDQSQCLQVLQWIQPYIGGPPLETIPFDFDNTIHLEALLNSMWGERLSLQALPAHFHQQGRAATDKLNMYLHECYGHRNSPCKLSLRHVRKKQEEFLVALKKLCDTGTLGNQEQREWIEHNVIDMLLNPPLPARTWRDRASAVVDGVVSLYRSFLPTDGGSGKDQSKDYSEESYASTAQTTGAVDSSSLARRRTISRTLPETQESV